jgi:hypothetical protein
MPEPTPPELQEKIRANFAAQERALRERQRNRVDVDPVGYGQSTVDAILSLLEDIESNRLDPLHVAGDCWEQLVDDLARVQQDIRHVYANKAEGDRNAEQYAGAKVL